MGSSLGIPQGSVHKILIYHKQQIFSYRIKEAVSLNSLPHEIGSDIDLVCPTSSFFTNIVIESSWMGAIRRPCSSIRRGGVKLLCQALCLSTILASCFNRNISLNPLAQIWGSMKFGVPSLALWCLLQWIWCYPVFSLWNSACSPRTLECMWIWSLATHHGNYTGGVFALVDDNDSIVLVTEPQIPVNLKSALVGLAL